MGDLTDKEKQAILDRNSPEAKGIDQKMIDAVNARRGKGKKHEQVDPRSPEERRAQETQRQALDSLMRDGEMPKEKVKKYKKGGVVRGCKKIQTQGKRKAKYI